MIYLISSPGSRYPAGCCFFVDFDGTLTPIVESPDQAVLHREDARQTGVGSRKCPALRDYRQLRALGDIRERVGSANLTYAGNHGLEICGDGLHFVEPIAVQRIKMLCELSRRLRERLRHIPGVEIENKVLTTSVHFRKARRGSSDEIRKTIEAELAFSKRIFRVTQGLQVLEIRPRVD